MASRENRVDKISFVAEGLPIGPCANHIFFVGKLAYITILAGRHPAPQPGLIARGRL